MIIDCHGHYTTEPKPLTDFRQKQIAGAERPVAGAVPVIGEDQRR